MKNFDDINPQVCVNAKLRRLHRLLNNEYQAQINPFGLRGSMLSIMFLIGKQTGINQKKLSEVLVLDQSTISRDVKKLESKGWIKQTKGIDSRNVELSVTKDGFKLLEKVSPIWQRLQLNVEATLGTKNLGLIDKLISTLENNIEKINA